MKTIMIDMDDVITSANFLGLISDFLGYHVGEESIKGYYQQDVLGDKKDAFFEHFKTINLYENASLADNCFETMNKLNNKYDVFICSTYIWPEIVKDCGNILKYKYDFLYKELPFIDPNKYIFSTNKKIVNCDVKIDDKLDNLEGASIKLLFTAYHNKNLSDDYLRELGVIRVNNWLDVNNILLEDN